MRNLSYLLAAALLAVVAADASAVIVTNTTTNTILFEDDFEGVSAVNLGFDDDFGPDFDPVASPGTWSTIAESDDGQIQVTQFAGTTSQGTDYPGAAQGDNYLWVNRTGGFNRASGDFTPQINGDMGAGPNAGDSIRIEFQLYAREFEGEAPNFSGPDVFALYQDAGGQEGPRILRLNIQGDNNITQGLTNPPSPDGFDTGLDWANDTWETWRIDLVIGGSTYDLTVAGNTATGLALETVATIETISSFRFGSNSATEYFVDAALPAPGPDADFNSDTVVDGADLNQWEGDFGLNDESDADFDGDSDGADFLVWQRQFAPAPGISASTRAIPEPSSACLLVLSTAVLMMRIRR